MTSTKSKFPFYLAVIATLLCCTPTWAQDTNYWSDQFGTQGMLLSGAIIGSVSDMSATYYNPGGLGYIAEPSVLVSTNAYQISNLTVENGAGEGVNLESSRLNILPNLVAGAFRFAWLGKHKLAYSLLTRYRFDAELKGTRVGQVDVLPDSPGEEEFAGGVISRAKTKELWIGLTWAYGKNDKVGFGITQYLSARDQDGQFELFAQAMDNAGNVALGYDIDNYSAQVYSLLWKAGLGIHLKPFTLGLTLTTPNVRLFGSGNTTINSTRIGLDQDGDGVPDDYFETDIQQEVTANYHSPLAVGFGAAWYLPHTKIHFSTEWFNQVTGYQVLELQPFTSQRTGEQVTRTITHAHSSVVNFALGLEHDLGEKTTGYLSFNTDESAFDAQSEVSVTELDIYHATAGANFTFAKLQVMLGIRYAWGSQQAKQVIDFDPEDGEEIADSNDLVDVKYNQFTLLLGFSARI